MNESSLDNGSQNVQFSDQVPLWNYTVDSMPDSTFAVADTDDANLENFFSRPVKIQSFSWATGTNLFERFDPWVNYFTNPRVINRISNFNLLRCKLHVRFVLNGNSFHFGRAIASYTPLNKLDEFTQERAFFIQDVVAASQRPHVYLDPTTSQGGTLNLPFVYWKNAMSIPDMGWGDMGSITIHGMQELKHANGATDQVIISVFAWAEDVSLSIPTAAEPGALAPQCGEVFDPQVRDEYGTGPISRPAAIVARAAGALSDVPTIGPYAIATKMAADALAGAARAFGYSRPIELADITPYKPTYLGNMVNTNVPDTSQKLTLDVKQELTVDPRVMGLGDTDEMTISSIARRESYLTSFAWNVASPTETLLWNSEVSPVLWSELNTEVHMPACCFAALPFRRWRGSMKFRFQIVASAFHKGRLKISYDPSYPLTDEYNTNYIYITDLAKEKDFTVEIGWGAERALLNHRDVTTDPVPYSVTKLTSTPGSRGNGILSVYVMNDLTVPNSVADNDVEVNVFVSAGDDFEVVDPESTNIEGLTWFDPAVVPTAIFNPPTRSTRVFPPIMRAREIFEPQSGTSPDEDLTIDENEPMKLNPSETMAPTLDDTDHTMCVFYGDPVLSFRQCLKRYNYHSAISPLASGNNIVRVTNSDFPYYRGYAPGAVHTSVTAPYNYCKMTLLNYLVPAYTCRRGGQRWKYFRTGGDSDSFMMVSASSSTGNYEQFEVGVIGLSGSTNGARVRQAAVQFPHMWDGAVVTSTTQNPVVEVEIPQYTNVRFLPAKQANLTGPGPQFQRFHDLTTIWNTQDQDAPLIHCYVSVAEDFNLGFYTGPPVAYKLPQASDPAGAAVPP